MPFRFLDYLLRDTIEAAILTRFGALANIPAPERYAVHKLIVSTTRRDTGESVKADKDVFQAGILIEALSTRRRHDDLAAAWREAWDRGEGWRTRLTAAIARLGDALKSIIEAMRV